jgi:RNA polymerase sigma-70 factor (ECF subfamily)
MVLGDPTDNWLRPRITPQGPLPGNIFLAIGSYGMESAVAPLFTVNRELDLEAIVDRFHQPLYRFALSLSRDEIEAADLTQQTFYILAQRSHQIRDHSKVKSWLYTTLKREYLRVIRAQTSHPHVEFRPELHDSKAPVVDAVRRLDGLEVVAALKRVDPTYRAAVELFYLGEFSYKEIAEMLEIPIGTVMSRLSRGKDQLKQVLTAAIAENKIIPLPKDEEAAH